MTNTLSSKREISIWNLLKNDPVLQRLQPPGMPLLYEDEGMEMGESTIHTLTCGVLFYGVKLHFVRRKDIHVFTNLNLYYSSDDPRLYVSPDVMLVKSSRRFAKDMSSYTIGVDGPAPCLAAEVLSFRTWEEGDMTNKPVVYSGLGIAEYILADVTGAMLPQKLALLRRQPNGKWLDEQDADGGVTSRLGFRLIVERDGQLRVIDARSGERYPRPDEAGQELREMKAAHQKEVELRLRLEAEIEKLRGVMGKGKRSGNGNKGRRKS